MQNYMKTILNGFKTWVSDVVKTSTADWNQSNKEAANYIKNRTHYDDIIKTDISGATHIVEIADLVSQTEEAIPLEVGQIWNSYRLIRDTQEWVEYRTFEVKQAEDGSFYIGYPSLIDENNATVIYLTTNELTVPDGMRMQGYSAFKFTCVSGYVTSRSTKQLDPKYIPDTIARVDDISQPNWDQNDENASDYIKNRPFYKTDGTYIGMGQFVATSATELKHTTAAGDEFYEVVIPYLNTISGKGEICNIKIGENSGKISCNFDRGWYSISGMLSGSMLPWQTGEVWTLKSNNESVAFLEGSTYDIEFFDTLDPYKKMDPGYLPDIVYTSENAPVKFGDGQGCTVQGVDTIASGYAAHAEGWKTIATGEKSHAEGRETMATGDNSHAEGRETMATGYNSHAAGNHTVANQYGMYVFGDYNQVFNDMWLEVVSPLTQTLNSTVEFYCSDEYTFDASTGIFTLVNPKLQTGVSIGKYCTSSSSDIDNLTHIIKVISTAGGNKYNTLDYTRWNKRTSRGDYVHIVGNGVSENTRSNAHTLDWSGNAWYSGDVYVGSTSGTNKDEGSKKLATEEFVHSSGHPQMYLTDQTTGFQYTIAVDNGSLVSAPRPFTYTITTEPTTTTYTAGEYFDATGLATAVVYDDDSSKEIADYHFPAEYLAEGTTEVTITATILGSEHSATTAVTVTALDPATYLANYTYTDNGDGTYTVTGWADTTKTDELTIPNNYFVKMGG